MQTILRLPVGASVLAEALVAQSGGTLRANPDGKTWIYQGGSLPEALQGFVEAGKGEERTFVLEIPFTAWPAAQGAGAKWDEKLKTHVYRGSHLPFELSIFKAPDFSLARLHEAKLNKESIESARGSGKIKPRLHQVEGIQAIRSARAARRCGILIADDVGLGKTITSWGAVQEMKDIKTVLIISPLAVVAHWRSVIREMGDAGKKVVVLNYDRLSKLFSATKSVKDAKRRRTKNKRLASDGEPMSFDLVILDESHRCRNPQAQRSVMARRLVEKSKFTMWLSATAGQNPLELSYLAPLLAESTGSKAKDLNEFEQWCISQGIKVSRGAYGKWLWEGGDDDCEQVRQILFGGPVPAGIRRRPEDVAGWPEINRILFPMELEGEDRVLYEKAWDEFRSAMKLANKGAKKSQNALVARLRFRQKSSLLRAPSTVELAEYLIENGRRVAISVQFKETLEVIRDLLEKRGITCAEIHGDQEAGLKESERVRFQTGKVQAILFTVEEGISLHRTDDDPVDRVEIVHDLRYSAIQTAQIEGRCHRDGQNAAVYYVYAEDTVEEDVGRAMVARMVSMKNMQGDDTAALKEIESILEKAATKGIEAEAA